MQVIGRYTVDSPFAAGGMASVHLGRAQGPMGFARTVAVKRLLPALASDPAFTARFLDEARLAARVRHVNVVPTLDVVAEHDELIIVMEYVSGLSLAAVLLQDSVAFGKAAASPAQRVPLAVVSALMSDVLEGLHAAHTATTETGACLSLVHRDVSPQNVLVGSDGVARVIDFGVATASQGLPGEGERHVMGKLGYMAPEQLRGEQVTSAADVYSAAVVLWELLAHRRLMSDGVDTHMERVLIGDLDGPRRFVPAVPVAMESVVMQGLSAAPARRFATAHEMAVALQAACPRATALEVATWLKEVAGAALAQRADDVARFESMPEGALAQVRPSTLGVVVFDPTVTVRALPDVTAVIAPRAVPERRGHRPGSKVAALSALAVLVALAAIALIVVAMRARAPAGAAAEPSAGSATEAAPAETVTTTDPAVAASGEPTEPATSLPAAARTGPHRRGTKTPPSSGAAPRALGSVLAASCKVPFYFDAEGMKHYRPECVR